MKITFKNNMSVNDVRFKRGFVAKVPGDIDQEMADKLLKNGHVIEVDDKRPVVTKAVPVKD